MVDRIRIGGHGFALVVAPDGDARRARRSRQEGAGRAVAQHGRTIRWCGPCARRNGAGPVSSEYMDGGVQQARRRDGDRAARVDGHRRAADRRGLRQRHPAPAAAVRGDFSGAAGDDLGRLRVRALVHLADPDAAARAPRRWPSGQLDGARGHPNRRRVLGSRRRVQHDGQSAGRAAGETSSGRSGRR